MNGWIKKFADGSIETGSDDLVKRKLASWSKGRLDHLVEVELHQNGFEVTLEGTGEFWQSDDYDCDVGGLTSSLVMRRIQKKINKHDRFLGISGYGPYKNFRLFSYKINPREENIRRISEAMVGKWFTIEVNPQGQGAIFTFKENRI